MTIGELIGFLGDVGDDELEVQVVVFGGEEEGMNIISAEYQRTLASRPSKVAELPTDYAEHVYLYV